MILLGSNEKEDFVLWTAPNNPDLAEVTAWIKQHAKKLSDPNNYQFIMRIVEPHA